MKEWLKNRLAYLFSRYIMPDYEAHQRAARIEITAETIMLRNELKSWKNRAVQAEKHVSMFLEVSDNVVKNAMAVEGGEMNPFVHQTVVDIENARRYVA